MGTKTPETHAIDVVNCARCEENHTNLSFSRFTNAPKKSLYTHWALCPTNGEPILMWIEDDAQALKGE